MRIVSSALLVASLGSGCDVLGPQCEEPVSLVDVQGWSLVPADEDPFVDGDPATFFAPPDDLDDPRPHRCTEQETQPTELGGEPAFDIDTQRGCNWATLEQTLGDDLAEGEKITLRIFYFSQFAFEEAEAQVIFQIGDDVLADERIPVPTGSGLIAIQDPSPFSAQRGERVLWHVGNHGDNSWNFLELSKFRPAPCPDTTEVEP